MKIQAVQKYYNNLNGRNTNIRKVSSAPSFQGTAGKVNGALHGSMLGGLGWAICAGTMPFLLPAVLGGALVMGMVENKLEDIANEDDKNE